MSATITIVTSGQATKTPEALAREFARLAILAGFNLERATISGRPVCKTCPRCGDVRGLPCAACQGSGQGEPYAK